MSIFCTSASTPQWRGGAVAPRSVGDFGGGHSVVVAAMEGGRSSPPEEQLPNGGTMPMIRAAMEGGRSSPPEAGLGVLFQKMNISRNGGGAQ